MAHAPYHVPGCSVVLVALFGALVGPAQAADYYRSYHRHGGYHHHWHVWHGDCCARPVIVYVPRERYLRLVEQMHFCAYCDNPPTRYVADPYWAPVYVVEGYPGY
jgi:hypothetical protein